MLFGIWAWAFCHLVITYMATIPVEEMDFSAIDYPPPCFLSVGLGGLLAVLRLMSYAFEVKPSLSVWGRIVNRKLILPGYDRVFIVPGFLVMLGVSLAVAGHWLSIPLELFLPVAVTILIFVTFTAPPSLEEWRLASNNHLRIWSSSAMRSDYVQTQ